MLLTHERDSKVLYGSLYEFQSWKLELWQHHGYHETQQYKFINLKKYSFDHLLTLSLVHSDKILTKEVLKGLGIC